MLLPSKIVSYNESVISKFAPILDLLSLPLSPSEIYRQMQGGLYSPTELIDALDCLYALGAIDVDNDGRVFRC